MTLNKIITLLLDDLAAVLHEKVDVLKQLERVVPQAHLLRGHDTVKTQLDVPVVGLRAVDFDVRGELIEVDGLAHQLHDEGVQVLDEAPELHLAVVLPAELIGLLDGCDVEFLELLVQTHGLHDRLLGLPEHLHSLAHVRGGLAVLSAGGLVDHVLRLLLSLNVLNVNELNGL